MVASIVQEGAKEGNNGAAAVLVLPAAPVPGDGRYLIACFHSPSLNAVPQWSAAGFTEFAGAAADDAGRYTGFGYRKIVPGDGATWTMSAEVADPLLETEVSDFHVWEVRGLAFDQATLLHDVQVGVAGTYTSMQPGAVDITTAQGAIVFTAAGTAGLTGGGETISDGFSSPTAGVAVHKYTITGYKVITAITSGINPTIAWTTSRRATALSIALKASVPVSNYNVKVYDGTVWKNHEIRRITG